MPSTKSPAVVPEGLRQVVALSRGYCTPLKFHRIHHRFGQGDSEGGDQHAPILGESGRNRQAKYHLQVPCSDWPTLSSFLEVNGFSANHDWDQLRHFREELYRVNETRNLTRVPVEDFEVRHVVDSLLVAPLLEGCASVLDIGAGPGFPAWPLAWLLPGVKVTAVESNSKMADFARSVALPNLTVVQERMESMDWVEEFDAVTGRAVAPFSIQLEISAAPCRIGGRVVPFRVPEERPFIETFNAGRIGLELSAMIEIPLPGSETNRLFPIYTKVRATPSEFPRPWARMKARPL